MIQIKIAILSMSILVIALVIICGCKTNRSITNAQPDIDLITFSAGNCRGRCEVFTLKIRSKCEAEYIGKKNVANLGEFSAKIDSNDYALLEIALLEAGFVHLESEYLTGAKDIQVFNISYQEKMVRFQRRRAPQQLLDLLEKLKSFVEAQAWQKVTA